MKSKKLKNNTSCEFCKKSLTDDMLIKHSCEKKRRWMERDTKTSRIAFMAFERFFQLNYPKKSKKEFMDFINSRYYTSFIRFSRYISLLNNLDINQYVDYIIKNQVPLSDWDKSYVFESYVNNKNKRESIDDAFIRSISKIKELSDYYEENWKEFFSIIDKNEIKSYIRNGDISPWMLFIMKGEDFLERLTEQDLLELDFILDFKFWNKKIAINKKRMNELKTIIGL